MTSISSKRSISPQDPLEDSSTAEESAELLAGLRTLLGRGTWFQTPDWFSGFSMAWAHHLPAAFALVQALRPKTFVELGTHGGDSYCSFCQAVHELNLDAQCYAVDTWQGDDHSGHYDPHVLDVLRAYHDPRYGQFSELLQMTFDAARSRFKDGSIDLLHVDGYHTYEAVRHDFENWLPAMSPRGVVLFHDTQVYDQDFGVWKFWEEIREQYPHFELAQVHGLGVLAVGNELPQPFKDLILAANESEEFHRLFDVLGDRSDLLAERVLRTQELNAYRTHATLLLAQLEELNPLREQCAELTERNRILTERNRILADQNAALPLEKAAIVAQCTALKEANGQLEEEKVNLQLEFDRLISYYQQLRFRLADRCNFLLRKTGRLHSAAKYILGGSNRAA